MQLIQIFSLSISDSLIIFDAVINHGRKIQFYNISDKSLGYIKNDSWDSRDPINYNNKLYYVNDKHGIFNLVTDDGINSNYLTNVRGGVFMPDISIDGKISGLIRVLSRFVRWSNHLSLFLNLSSSNRFIIFFF